MQTLTGIMRRTAHRSMVTSEQDRLAILADGTDRKYMLSVTWGSFVHLHLGRALKQLNHLRTAAAFCAIVLN